MRNREAAVKALDGSEPMNEGVSWVRLDLAPPGRGRLQGLAEQSPHGAFAKHLALDDPSARSSVVNASLRGAEERRSSNRRSGVALARESLLRGCPQTSHRRC